MQEEPGPDESCCRYRPLRNCKTGRPTPTHGGGLAAGRAIGFQPPRRPWHRQRQHQHSHQQRHSEKWLADRHGRLPKAKYNKAGGILVAFIYLEEGFCTMNNHTGRVICAGLYIGGELQGLCEISVLLTFLISSTRRARLDTAADCSRGFLKLHLRWYSERNTACSYRDCSAALAIWSDTHTHEEREREPVVPGRSKSVSILYTRRARSN